MIGQSVSHYKILEKIGAGGMGEVYLAEDTKLGRKVALKFLPAELSRDSQASRRFTREARAASALEHPNICSVHSIESTRDGRMFICMSYCEGESLKDVIARGPVSAEEAVKIAVKIAEGLAAAHKADVVHRDVKPANIIVNENRGVKIIDFGLAKLAGASRVTKDGATVGTIGYKSPEQVRGDDVDGRADIWSLGMVLFEMLTGESAFGGEFGQATVQSILNEAPRQVTDLSREVPAALGRIVDRCLQKNPDDRYGTARELADDLDRVAGELGWPGASRGSYRSSAAVRHRRRIITGIVAASVLVGLVAVIVAVRLSCGG